VATLRNKLKQSLASLLTPPNTALTFVEPTPPDTARVAATVVASTVASVAAKARATPPNTARLAATVVTSTVAAIAMEMESRDVEPQAGASEIPTLSEHQAESSAEDWKGNIDAAPQVATELEVVEDHACKIEDQHSENPEEKSCEPHHAARDDLFKAIMEMNVDYSIEETSDGSVILRPPAPPNAERIVEVEASTGEAGGFVIALWDNDFATVLGDGLVATSPLRLWNLKDGHACTEDGL
jgi:hypothetical protein